jgi:hypothetical protein
VGRGPWAVTKDLGGVITIGGHNHLPYFVEQNIKVLASQIVLILKFSTQQNSSSGFIEDGLTVFLLVVIAMSQKKCLLKFKLEIIDAQSQAER